MPRGNLLQQTARLWVLTSDYCPESSAILHGSACSGGCGGQVLLLSSAPGLLWRDGAEKGVFSQLDQKVERKSWVAKQHTQMMMLVSRIKVKGIRERS